MATTAEKISKFDSAINHYAEAQRAKILEDIENFKERELKETEATAKVEAERLMIKEVEIEKSNIVREMSHKELDGRRELLQKRQEIADKVFNDAKEKLRSFVSSSEYPSFLERKAKEAASIFTQEGTVIYIRNADSSYASRISSQFKNASVEYDDSIEIGGFRAENKAMHLACDNTLESELEAQRLWFEETTGLKIV